MIIMNSELKEVFAINGTYLLEFLEKEVLELEKFTDETLEVQRIGQNLFNIVETQGGIHVTLSITDYSAELVLDNDTLLVALVEACDNNFEQKLAFYAIKAFLNAL